MRHASKEAAASSILVQTRQRLPSTKRCTRRAVCCARCWQRALRSSAWWTLKSSRQKSERPLRSRFLQGLSANAPLGTHSDTLSLTHLPTHSFISLARMRARALSLFISPFLSCSYFSCPILSLCLSSAADDLAIYLFFGLRPRTRTKKRREKKKRKENSPPRESISHEEDNPSGKCVVY